MALCIHTGTVGESSTLGPSAPPELHVHLAVNVKGGVFPPPVFTPSDSTSHWQLPSEQGVIRTGMLGGKIW